MIYKTFDVVVVPFPFTDKPNSKRRPALVISSQETFNAPSGHTVFAMITSAGHASWPLDVPVSDLAAAGLSSPSYIRMKLFTIDNHLIITKIGQLSLSDRKATKLTCKKLFNKLFIR